MDAMVTIRGLSKRYGAREVLRGIDLDVAAGRVLCVIGPSGSGKSTLLSCINHLERIDAGRIWVAGELVGYRERGGVLYELPERQIARMRQRVGMVFQQFNLFPHMTALQNVTEAPVQVKRTPAAEAPPGRWRCWSAWAWRPSTRASPPSFRAASSSGSRLPARWRWTPC